MKYCSVECRNKSFGALPHMFGNKYSWKGDEACVSAHYARSQNKFNIKRKYCICGNKAEIRHHHDRNIKNNSNANVKFMCRGCHIKEHRSDLVYGQRAMSAKG